MLFKVKHYISICLPLICLLILIGNSHTAISGAKNGLSLWANVIIPTLLPFILLTNSLLSGQLLPRLVNHPVLSHFKPCIWLCVIIGFLCGYPMGGKFVNDLYTGGFLDRRLAKILLVFCNNASPMFVIGYVLHYGLTDSIPPCIVFLLLYIPNILLFSIRYLYYKKYASKSADFHMQEHPNTFPDIIKKSIESVMIIGVYIMLFSILTSLLKRFVNQYTLLPIASLEITVGISLLHTHMFSGHIQTTYILALTAFGGFSAIAQTRSVAPALENTFMGYTIWKLFLGLCTGLLSYICL